MASMAQFVPDPLRTDELDGSSDDSTRLLSRMSTCSASTVLLVSSVVSDSEYQSCLNEMPSEMELSIEFLSDGSELEEPKLPLEDDNWPSTVQIYSIPLTPSSSLLPLLPFFFLCSIDQSVQSNEHKLVRPRDGATLVIWDPKLPGSFPPASCSSILPAWWHSTECYGTFGEAAYMNLSEPACYRRRFPSKRSAK